MWTVCGTCWCVEEQWTLIIIKSLAIINSLLIRVISFMTLLPHILMDLDRHTLCSVLLRFLLISLFTMISLSVTNYLVRLPPGHQCGLDVVWLFFFFFFHQDVKFSITWIEGRRTEDVVHCADCKAHCGKVIVILGNINNIDLIWFDYLQ